MKKLSDFLRESFDLEKIDNKIQSLFKKDKLHTIDKKLLIDGMLEVAKRIRYVDVVKDFDLDLEIRKTGDIVLWGNDSKNDKSKRVTWGKARIIGYPKSNITARKKTDELKAGNPNIDSVVYVHRNKEEYYITGLLGTLLRTGINKYGK